MARNAEVAVPKVKPISKRGSPLPFLISLPLLYLLLLYIIPISVMVLYSFWDVDARGRVVPTWSLGQYVKILASSTYAKTLLKSLFMATSVTVLCLLVAYPVAFFIARMAPKRWKYLLLVWVIMPSWTSFLIRTYSWMVVLGEKGMLNYSLLELGILSRPRSLLFSYPAVFIGLTHIYFPYMFLPIFASVEKIQPHLLEMAENLGASTLQKFQRVILPLSTPGIVAGGFLVFIPSLGEYVIPMILGGTRGFMYGNVIQSAFGSLNWPLGSALAFFLLAIILVMFLLYSQFFRIQDIWAG